MTTDTTSPATTTTAALELADLLDQAHTLVDALLLAWGWLWAQVDPGRAAPPPSRAQSDAQAAHLTARGLSDRAYRDWNLARGMSALPPSPAPVRLAVVDAMCAVHGQVIDTTLRLAAAIRWTYPATRGHTGHQVVAALGWLAGTRRPARPWIVDTTGACWRDPTPIDMLRDHTTATRLVRDLDRAVRTTRQAAGVSGDQVVPVPRRCPACGRRSLQLDAEPRDRRQWSVRCVSASCRCAGATCPCLARVRYTGRVHAWAYGELDQLTAAIDTHARQVERITSGQQGHGRWR